MKHTLTAPESLQKELISRVSALEGKQCAISSNRKSLSATVDALAECTDVDQTVIQQIADQLAVQPGYIEPDNNCDATIKLERNTRRAKYFAIGLILLFTWSMIKWFNINNTIKSVMHDVSSVQSRIADFHLRTGRYPHSFESIDMPQPPNLASVKKIEIGPNGQLLIETQGIFGNQLMLTPVSRNNGWSQWQCTTNASRLFIITTWVCGYSSSLQFKV